MGGSRIHRNKSWYYLRPFQISKVELYAKIVLGHIPLTFFVKSSSFNAWLVSYFVSEDFVSWIKPCNIYTPMLEFTFPGKDVIDSKGGEQLGRRIVRVGGICRILHLRESLITGKLVQIFPKIWYCPPLLQLGYTE